MKKRNDGVIFFHLADTIERALMAVFVACLPGLPGETAAGQRGQSVIGFAPAVPDILTFAIVVSCIPCE